MPREELDDVEEAWKGSRRVLFVGFNRRWSAAVGAVRQHFAPGHGPLVVTYRVNAGSLPESHWYHGRRKGGRLLGDGTAVTKGADDHTYISMF